MLKSHREKDHVEANSILSHACGANLSFFFKIKIRFGATEQTGGETLA